MARLPTEGEWEWAARGRDEARTYPWGSDAPGQNLCWKGLVPDPDSTCPAGSFTPSGDSRDGLMDMAGNVFEWTSSWNSNQTARVIRGGSWTITNAVFVQTNNRNTADPALRNSQYGFRCVMPE